jgi:hypothetical protein
MMLSVVRRSYSARRGLNHSRKALQSPNHPSGKSIGIPPIRKKE